MKILYIFQDNQPFHTFRGGGQRTTLIYKALKEIGDVELAVLVNPNQPFYENYIESPYNLIYLDNAPKNKYFHQKFFNFLKFFINPFRKNSNLEKKIDYIIKQKKIDIIFVRYLNPASLGNLQKYSNLIVDIDDLPQDQFLIRKNNNIPNFIIKLLYSRYKTNYYKLIKKIPISFVSNPTQKANSHQRVLVNIPFFNNNLKINNLNRRIKNTALYIGSLDYHVNYESLLYFVKNVWPLIINEIPEFQFNIVGKGLPESIKAEISNIKGINLLGYVENLETLFTQNSIYISPVYTGTGTNIKILEAIKYKIPIVATPISLRGYEHFLKDGENILIGNNDKDFIEKILLLSQNEIMQNKLASKASLSLSKEGYDFDSFKKVIENSCKEIISSKINY